MANVADIMCYCNVNENDKKQKNCQIISEDEIEKQMNDIICYKSKII